MDLTEYSILKQYYSTNTEGTYARVTAVHKEQKKKGGFYYDYY